MDKMAKGEQAQGLGESLEQVERRFKQWRQTRRRGEHIPAPLWAVADVHGLAQPGTRAYAWLASVIDTCHLRGACCLPTLAGTIAAARKGLTPRSASDPRPAARLGRRRSLLNRGAERLPSMA